MRLHRQVAGVNGAGPPALAFAPPSPNPARGPVRLSLPRAAPPGPLSVVILDAAGRRVRDLSRDVAAGPVEVAWDLRDGAGRRVPPGLYFASVRLGAASTWRGPSSCSNESHGCPLWSVTERGGPRMHSA